MEKLKELLSLCKCSVALAVNAHKDYYQTAEQSLAEDSEESLRHTDPEVIAEMIKRDTIITLSVYPNNPVGSYWFYHYDIETIIDQAIATIKEHRTNTPPSAHQN